MTYTLRTPYNYDRQANTATNGVWNDGKTKTVQSQKEQSDINWIVKQFGLTGKLPENVRIPTYMDYDGVTDFHTAQNIIADARSNFMTMPAEIRRQFGDNPQNFLVFCENPDNLPKLVEMGLAKEKPDGQQTCGRSNLHGKEIPTGKGKPGSSAGGTEESRPRRKSDSGGDRPDADTDA